ncbi:MerR family transcriptional regulator [Desulfurivibrio alkaliphilus]|uniref:Transcriptional regulator, MerR family n=1 Tax=Desulfurivibrio alkaliphilus (strain DSM 19089 / UNIQEM U267 / AHT2) TaxID=589865 RepID=D6Z309_DESAT|nr:MerR family transcriptional regulator [Desulfurivibrio alkaliphilus]ADH85934.1 transcriptional regulator, MerR family [Desulfurivibrio alkaliphilus AHT 2]
MSAAEQQGPGIPDKLYFKIGEVCEITGVKQHVLRYWESEFRILAPQRANSRQRLYRRSDVENILRIKRLLKEEGFTISGAKKLLARERKKGVPREPDKVGAPAPAGPPAEASAKAPAADAQPNPAEFFSGIKEELQNLKKILER